jgi:hypothetical protein
MPAVARIFDGEKEAKLIALACSKPPKGRDLSIHSKASLYEAFPAVEARRLVERFEWHYTPKTRQLARPGRV